jgi:hypothetical protein
MGIMGRITKAGLLALAASGLLLGSAVPAGAAPVRANVLDESKLASIIQKDLKKSLGSGVSVKVTCASNVPVVKGKKSTCTAVLNGQKLPYTVTQTSNNGDVTYKRTKAIIDLDKAQKLVSKQVAQQMGGKWKVTCKPAGSSRLYVIAVKKSFSCPITGKDGDGTTRTGKIVFDVKNIKGDVDWEAK